MVEKQNVELKLIHMEDVVSKEVEWLSSGLQAPLFLQ